MFPRAFSAAALFLVLGLLPCVAQAVTRDQAYAQCAARAALRDTQLPATAPNSCRVASIQPDGLKGSYIVVNKDGQDVGSLTFPWDGLGCPGQRWNEFSKQCVPSENDCKAKPPLSAGSFTRSGSGTACSDGCMFTPAVSVCTETNGQTMCSVGGARSDGSMCGAGDPSPTSDKAQECTPAGSGQTFCLKPDGQHCHTASTGRQVCWGVGETGEKNDGPVKQKRDAGTQPIQPNLNLPNGDTLTPTGTPVQTNTQVKDGSGTRNVTTVTQNYTTTNGTNAGGSNDGESGTGDGSGKEGEGDDGLGEEAAGLDNNDGSGDHQDESAWGQEGGDGFNGDASGFGFGNACPAPPTIRGETLDWAGLCDLMTAVGLLILAAAHMHALYIIAGD